MTSPITSQSTVGQMTGLWLQQLRAEGRIDKGTINESGLYTAPSVATSAVVRATSVANPTKYGIAGVAVKKRATIQYFASSFGVDGLPTHNVQDVSENGLTAVGNLSGFPAPAAYWTSTTGWVTLPFPPGADDATGAPTNRSLLASKMTVFECPSDPHPDTFEIEPEGGGSPIATLAVANYVGLFGFEYVGPLPHPGDHRDLHVCEELAPGQQCAGDGVLFHNSKVTLGHITDGTSNTIMVGERQSQRKPPLPVFYSTWPGAVPGGEEAFARVLGSTQHVPNAALSEEDFSSAHTGGGAHFILADGHAKFVSQSISLDVFRAIGTRAGGEAVGEF